ncbi:MAG: hydrolase [Bacteroidales bacterium]
MHIPSRAEAYELLLKHNKSTHLIRHALAVEGVMRHYAGILGEDEDHWGIIGLVHDLDYEEFPDEHCKKTKQILQDLDWPEDWIRAIMSHGWGMCTDQEPLRPMEKILYAIDELTGLVAAAALVRPDKSIMSLEVSSVKKRWKARGFAAGANREVIEKGAAMAEVPLDKLIEETIAGMRKVARETGLAGS